MRFLVKSFLLIFFIFTAALYINGCSSAEQTTGKIAYQQEDYEKAEMEFEKETMQNPLNEEAWGYLAMSRLQLDKLSSAIEAFQQYKKIGKFSLSSEFDNLLNKIFKSGVQYYKQGTETAVDSTKKIMYKNALEEFKKGLVIYPDSTFLIMNAALSYEKLDSNEQAIESYRNILRIDKSDTVVAKRLIRLINDNTPNLLREEKYQESIDILGNMLTLPVKKDDFFYELTEFNMGVTYLAWGEKIRITNQETDPNNKSYLEKYKEALKYLEPLKNSSNKELLLPTYSYLVQVYGNLNMNDEAINAMEKRDELKLIQDENK